VYDTDSHMWVFKENYYEPVPRLLGPSGNQDKKR
jgi:hypothetical protein